MASPKSEICLYVHWPFCESKCPYCDFNSHAADEFDQSRWRRALLSELDHYAAETKDRIVTSIFFGGGTPSLMDPETVAHLIGAARRHWTCADEIEITLESNPSSAEAGRFAAYRDAGVDRLSLGVQSLNDGALRFLGRVHDAEQAIRALECAHAVFPRVSIDLIYARPGQTTADWRQELVEAVALAGEHVSAYQLTIEPGTAFHRDGLQALDNDAGADLWEVTQEITSDAGLVAYETSNHTRPRAECRHNVAIWRGADYIGVGPGAHGRVTHRGITEATRQTRTPDKWLAAVESAGHGTADRTPLNAMERAEELLMLGLRLTDGIDRQYFRARAGIAVENAIDTDGLARMVDGGFVEDDGMHVRATDQGRPRLDAVLRQLLT